VTGPDGHGSTPVQAPRRSHGVFPRRPTRAARGRRRAALAVGILAAWTLGAGLLVRREYFRERAEILAEAALRVAPGSWYYVVERNGRQIGFASTSIDTTSTAFEVVDYVIADRPDSAGTVVSAGSPTVAASPGAAAAFRGSTRAVITLSRALALRTFDVGVEAADGPRNVFGTAEGDSIIHTVTRAVGEPVDSQRLAVDGPVLMPTLVPVVAMLLEEPEVGNTITVAEFDPFTLEARDVRVRFAAESLFTLVDSATLDASGEMFVPALLDTVRAWKLVREEGTDANDYKWVDAQGRVVVSSEPGGIMLRRIAYEIAFENWRRGRGTGWAAGTAPAPIVDGADAENGILSGGVIAAGVLPVPGGPAEFSVRLSGSTPAGGVSGNVAAGVQAGDPAVAALALDGGRQRLHGDTLTVIQEFGAALEADWSLADRNADFRAAYRPELTPAPLLQSDNSSIIARAVRIAGAERDPRIVAERINAWVHDSLGKAVTANVPNALQAYRMRRGDAGEHAQLFAALARAVGIPTRVVTGLVYVDGSFHYHAWAEVLLRDWVAVDPTLGQFPADAAHVRLVLGEITRQGELLRLVGQHNLRLEVLLPGQR